ncbi:MAG TPA: dynamin family protein [Candidatus Eisenbergiella intestinipullorum]|nr:dynamin family protein [Candidatus Eisenbergiella intestinipullorum]
MAGNNKIRITYDPYRKLIKCEYQSEGGSKWELPSAGGELAKIFRQGTLNGASLQNYACEIIKGIISDYCMHGQGIDLLFRGTEEDWADFKTFVQKTELASQIVCKGEAGQLPCAKEIRPRIQEIFQKLYKEFEGLTEREVTEPIHQYLETMEPEVVLYVSGTYSAGKSTFINALIGEELLPSSVGPTTAHIYKIVAKAKGDWLDTEVYFQYLGMETALKFRQDGYTLENLNQLPDLNLKRCLDQALKDVEPGPAYICKALTLLNDFNERMNKENKDEETGNSDKKTYISPQIELHTPFYHSTLPLDKFCFVIFDTPGSNSANHEEHLAVMKESLEKQTNGLPILLVPSTQVDAKDVGVLRHEIHKIGGALDESNILVVVTQADTLPFWMLEDQAQGKEKMVASENAENRLCYVSSAMGFNSKKGSYPAMGGQNEEKRKKTESYFSKIVDDFKDGSTRLYQIDSLPPDQKEKICQEGDRANETGTEQERLFHNSGLWAVEREIEWFAGRFAGYNKCWQAQGYLSKAIEALKTTQTDKRKKIDELNKRKKTEFDQKKKELLDQIEEASNNWSVKNWNTISDVLLTICRSYIPNQKELADKVTEQWKEEKRKHKGRGGQNAIDPFKKWARNQVNKLINDGVTAIKEFAASFWPKKISEYKVTCISIVKGSSALTEEEKTFAEKFILEFESPKLPEVDLELKSGISKGNFLFFHWADVDSGRCANEMKSATEDALTSFNSEYLASQQEDIEKWLKDFQEGLKDNLDTINPKLVKLDEEIRAYEAQIATLEQAQGRLEEAQKELAGYFTINDENGGAK